MVLQVLANSGVLNEELGPVPLEDSFRANSGIFQDDRRLQCAGGKYDLLAKISATWPVSVFNTYTGWRAKPSAADFSKSTLITKVSVRRSRFGRVSTSGVKYADAE